MIPKISEGQSKIHKKTMAVITTGGTIAQKIDLLSGGAVPSLSGEDLIRSIPKLEELANLKVFPVANIDSRDMDFQIYTKLAHKIKQLNEDLEIDGLLILHGTDTMEETAFFLNQIIHPNKPIIITGAMRTASEKDADGPRNTINALRVILSSQSNNGNIMVVMNGNIINGLAVSKTDSSNVDAFNGGKRGVLGIVDEYHVTWYNKPIHFNKFKFPKTYPKIDIILAYPGADGSLVKAAVRNGAKGIVVVGYGVGNVSKKFFRTIKSVLKATADVTFLIQSRSPEGNILPIYAGEGGAVELQKLGVILGGPISATKSRILLMLCLSNNYSHKEIHYVFQKPERF
jgi:L-asparaginase